MLLQILAFLIAMNLLAFAAFGWDKRQARLGQWRVRESTLLMLVSALMGPEKIKQIYTHAVSQRYRFFSYGDASLLIP